MKSIYTLGPSGTFSMLVASKFSSKYQLDVVPVDTVSTIFTKLAKKEEAFGVLPIENSIAGTVGIHQDLLVEYSKNFGIKVQAEMYYQIKFGLLTNQTDLSRIEFVYAHPHAIEQCQLFKIKNLPKAQIHFTSSTVQACKDFLQDYEKKNKRIGAIVPLSYILNRTELSDFHYTKDYPKGIQDSDSSITRFFILKKQSSSQEPNFKKQKTSLFIESLKDEPALLHRILTPFTSLKLNLSLLHSKSSQTRPWIYNFFIDFYNTADFPKDTQLLLDTLARFDAIKVAVLGSYNSIADKETTL